MAMSEKCTTFLSSTNNRETLRLKRSNAEIILQHLVGDILNITAKTQVMP